jgi:hypothetical protein
MEKLMPHVPFFIAISFRVRRFHPIPCPVKILHPSNYLKFFMVLFLSFAGMQSFLPNNNLVRKISS